MGIVKDFRNGDILIVNFNNNNIITDNLKDLTIFVDKEEFDINKDDFEEERNKNNNNEQTKEIQTNSNLNSNNLNTKEIISDIIDHALQKDNIEKIANLINEKIIKEKINNFGIKDQKYSKECWIYSLSEIIYMANARKYGRKLDDFEEIYDDITKKYGKEGKTNGEMEIIMTDILPKYDLIYEKINEENKLKEFLKKGIRCLGSFGLNNLEWENFSNYFKDYSIKKEEKVLTKEILEKKLNYIKNPEEMGGRHAVVLIDIDDEDNYILVNSWGKYWGNNGLFKAKKECLKNSAFYAIYFNENILKKEENEAWKTLKDTIKKLLKEMKSIGCPICKRSAKIERFVVEDNNKLKCPFEKPYTFEIKKDNDNNYELEFLVEQLFNYKKKYFNFGLDSKINI